MLQWLSFLNAVLLMILCTLIKGLEWQMLLLKWPFLPWLIYPSVFLVFERTFFMKQTFHFDHKQRQRITIGEHLWNMCN